MTHKHVEFEDLAHELIDENGGIALLIRPGELDESTFPPTQGADTGFEFKAVQVGLNFGDRQEANTQMGDVKFLLATGDTDPTTSDAIKFSGWRYQVINVEQVAPEGIPVLWKVIARGGVPDETTYMAGRAITTEENETAGLDELIQDLPSLP